ncbi:XkdW family protein [Bacillus pumilus]|uniref:XkdW family protein n=1 Tax=Bacillus pumilus TaxID=1408 RepID=UPI0022800E2F|nr:XkdW family protein [Bacillus pumilus]MCY7500095.1 XkdW family protein [Bacillus pumilus]MCY7528581.1 XkdW family protein [Bacillus pumilus]MED4439459.1 XkdW family protein [Bacillus pumilus]MED4489902.1 XkdW family protein [Bacillus pumilus]
MNKALAIMYLFPNAILGKDFSVRDDGDGQFIDSWLMKDPEPSDEELYAAWQEYLKLDNGKPMSQVEKQLLLIGEQLAHEKIARQQSDRMNAMLGQQIAEMKIEILKLKGANQIES